MSHWCEQHPKYSAKRKPGSLCGKCWACQELADNNDVIDEILKQLVQRRK